jgi:uncharacterized protein (TIGR03118 family)
MFSFLRPLVASRAGRAQRRRHHRPQVESLEERHLLDTSFVQADLVSNIAGRARLTDAHLRNPWGIALAPNTGAFWISDAASGVSSLYTGDVNGSPVAVDPLVVTVPPAFGAGQGSPTGQVFNSTSDFVVRSGGSAAPAQFLFASRDGTISGWDSNVPRGSTQAIRAATVSGASYTGLALGSSAMGNLLFAANVAAGRVDIFDRNFTQVTIPGSFVDPGLPAGFVPFNVRNINGTLFVTYENRADRDHGGVVDLFDTGGHFLKRLATAGTLNGPWGLAVAPATFGTFANALLVGNFGDGRISAFNINTGAFLGQLTGANGQPIVLERLWGLVTGNGATAGDGQAIYFTAGINNERDGLFGSLRPQQAQTPNQRFVAQVYQDLLHRNVDPTGLSMWTAALSQGTTRKQVVQSIENSSEYRTVVVRDLFTTFLRRSADAVGLNIFTSQLASGGTIEQVQAAITGSQEYFQTQGHSNNSGFLDAIYRDALKRAVDSRGRASFLRALTTGTTRTQVATIIFTSPEFRNDLVRSYYTRFLHRNADAGGLATFVGLLNQNTRDEEVIADLVGSAEYFGRL